MDSLTVSVSVSRMKSRRDQVSRTSESRLAETPVSRSGSSYQFNRSKGEEAKNSPFKDGHSPVSFER